MKGNTDSELFFAYLLTELDAAGISCTPASPETDFVLRRATRVLCSNSTVGAANFLLSDGTTMYAHRCGRTLFVLDRGPEDPVREVRRSRDGTILIRVQIECSGVNSSDTGYFREFSWEA
jgi:hypothetical protein